MLEGLGHRVEAGFPDALADREAARQFGALWATNMAVAIRRFGEALGRELSADDVEPVNWDLADRARHLTAVDHAVALAAGHAFRRRVQQWWADGWDLLLTPTLAEPPLPIGTLANDESDPSAPMRRAGEFCPFTPPFNMSGQPAISLPLHWNEAGLPIGVQLVAAYGREDVLIRVSGQLETAHPWSNRHP